MPIYPYKQNGSTLVVALIMLVFLTLIVLTSINTSTMTTRIVGNIQDSQQTETSIQNAIEIVLSNVDNFMTNTVAMPVTVDGKEITVSARNCLTSMAAEGDSIVMGTTAGKEQTVWDVTAAYTDPVSDAEATIHQGVDILLPAGNCL